MYYISIHVEFYFSFSCTLTILQLLIFSLLFFLLLLKTSAFSLFLFIFIIMTLKVFPSCHSIVNYISLFYDFMECFWLSDWALFSFFFDRFMFYISIEDRIVFIMLKNFPLKFSLFFFANHFLTFFL